MKAWNTVEARTKSELERQVIQLQVINVLIKQGKTDHARVLLENVTEAKLQEQK